jgi:hypothetical protein
MAWLHAEGFGDPWMADRPFHGVQPRKQLRTFCDRFLQAASGDPQDVRESDADEGFG